jgi:hypothetical protein
LEEGKDHREIRANKCTVGTSIKMNSEVRKIRVIANEDGKEVSL